MDVGYGLGQPTMNTMHCKGMESEMADSTEQLLQHLQSGANGPRLDACGGGGVGGTVGGVGGQPDSHTDGMGDLITLNVGGARFVTTRPSLDRIPDTRLYNLQKTDSNFNHATGEWFFDRNPAVFNYILDFYRTDELHFPHNFCGPSIRKELNFWHIDEADISPCCWNRYREFEEERKIFDHIEQAFESHTVMRNTFTSADIASPSTWQVWRRRLYLLLEEPMSSRIAQIWTVVFLSFVLMSIGILCIETLPKLRVPIEGRVDPLSTTDMVSQPTTIAGKMVRDNVTYTLDTPKAGGGSTTLNTTRAKTDAPAVPDDGYSEYERQLLNTNPKIRRLINTQPHPVLENIDSFCTCFFTIEFIVRLIVAPNRIKFMRSMMNIIDILCVLPMWIKYIMILYEIEMNIELLPVFFLIMMLRVLRICRVLRLARHYTGVKILLLALRASFKELGMLVIFVFIVVLMFAVVVYYAEFFQHDTFDNIPAGYWWAIITLTTVGYGDMYPKSGLGYVVGALCALTGILATGLPVPIIANNFNLYYSHAQLKDAVMNRKKSHRRPSSASDDTAKQPATDHTDVQKPEPFIVKEATV